MRNKQNSVIVLMLAVIMIPFITISADDNETPFPPAENVYPLDTLYHRPNDLFPAILRKADNYPHLVDWYISGESSNHKLPIYAFRITNKENVNSKPKILLHGQHHSEEVIGLEIVMHLSDYLLSKYEKDDFITTLIDNYELWFVPTSNPEGFAIVNSGEYRLKRKNETDTNMNGIRELNEDGVDLNRNYPFNWEKGDSVNPASPYFKGFEPACQAETRAMMSLYEQQNFNLAFFYHSSATGTYSERIFYPWIWNDEYSPDYEEMAYLAKTLASNLPRTYQPGKYRHHQISTSRQGFARDYIYSQHRTLAMLLEVGGNSPYGEGVLYPPNEVLLLHKKKHTAAMLELLKEYHHNLLSLRVVDKNNQPMADIEVTIDGRESPHTQNFTTCNQGYVHLYLVPRQEPYNFQIGNDSFSLNKTEKGQDEFTFKLSTAKEMLKPQITKLNDGEAIVMTNPVFQHFPPLSFHGEFNNVTSPDTAFLTLLDRFALAYRRSINLNNNQINIPWIPLDVIDKGVVTVQIKDIHPLLDDFKTPVKIVFLQQDSETLTYCLDKSVNKRLYLHPRTKTGIDYSLYPAGENNYFIDRIKIYGQAKNRHQTLDITLYDKAKPIKNLTAQYQGKPFIKSEFASRDDNNYFSVEMNEKTKLPDNLFLQISNNTSDFVVMHRDSIDYVTSSRSKVCYSYWQPLEGTDLAVEIILKKEP